MAKRRTVSPERRAQLQEQARKLNPPSRWTRQDCLDRIRSWCEAAGLDPDTMVSAVERMARDDGVSLATAVHRFVTGSKEPAKPAREPLGPRPDDEGGNDEVSVTGADTDSMADTGDPMASSVPPGPDHHVDDDPALASSLDQLGRELRHEVSDEELQAARAFCRHVEPAPTAGTARPQVTYEIVQAYRRYQLRRERSFPRG
jgi:hypothetical protein